MVYLIIAFLISFLVCLLIIKFISWQSICDISSGVQKFHPKPVPRIGGLAIYLACWSVSIVFYLIQKEFAKEFFLILICAFPVFFSGLLEDVTKKVSPHWRLFAAFISGGLAFFLLSAEVTSIDIKFFDKILACSWISFVFTTFAVAGVTHAFNIIDGFNGLCAGVSIIIFGAYAYVSFLVHDYFLLYLSLVMVFAILGFFVWNYPFGFIFLGDGGAYFLGYIAAILGVLITQKHPVVSSWFPLMLVIYPVWETLFSAYRRKFFKGISPSSPDAVHFHTLVYRRLVKFTFGKNLDITQRNFLTSPYLWIIEIMCVIPAIIFWKDTHILMVCVFIFIIFYTWLYFRIIKFRTPKIFKIKKEINNCP